MQSKFNGGLLGYIGIGLLMFVIIVFSLGLATPWAICIGHRWYAKHSIIDGHQVVFDGTGWQLFGNMVKWLLLTIITLGIFGLWLPIKNTQWVVKHTHLLPEAPMEYAPAPNQYPQQPQYPQAPAQQPQYPQQYTQAPAQQPQYPQQYAQAPAHYPQQRPVQYTQQRPVQYPQQPQQRPVQQPAPDGRYYAPAQQERRR